MRKPQSAWTTILQIFLLILIIVGVVLLSTTSHWVPGVVSFILKSESSQANSAPYNSSIASSTHPSTVANSSFPISSKTSTSSTVQATSTPVSTTSPTSVPVLNSITPSSGTVGSSVTISGNNFANSNTILFDGNVAARNVLAVTSPNDGSKTLTFTVPSSLSPDCKPDQACPMYVLLTSAKSYSVTVESSNDAVDASKRSNAIEFTVTGGTTLIPQ